METTDNQENNKALEETRFKKVVLQRTNEDEKKENIYIQNNNNESALSSFYGNNKLEKRKVGSALKQNLDEVPHSKFNNDHLEKKFYESDKLKNFRYEKEDVNYNHRPNRARNNESSNNDDRYTISNQDKLLSSNENFFRENYKGEVSPQKNYLRSIQTGGSLELSESKQQSDNDNNFHNTGSHNLNVDTKQSTQKFTFKNNKENIPEEENYNLQNSHMEKAGYNKNIKRNLNLRNNYEIETNTNTNKDNTSLSKETDAKDKNSYRAALNNHKQQSSEHESSSNTVKHENTKYNQTPYRDQNNSSQNKILKENDSKSGSIGFSSTRKNKDYENTNTNNEVHEKSNKSLEISQKFKKPSNLNNLTNSNSDEVMSMSQSGMFSVSSRDNQVINNVNNKEYSIHSNNINNAIKENNLNSNEMINREIEQLRKQNKILYDQLNHTKIQKKSLKNQLKKIEENYKIKEKQKKIPDYTPQKVFLGEFYEKVLENSLYLYKNNNCHTCTKLLSQGKSRKDCPKNH